MLFEGLQLGHYRLVRQIGSGGMGAVYFAEDTRMPSRKVAVKVSQQVTVQQLGTNELNDATQVFRNEMKALFALDNSHILPLLDFGTENVNGSVIAYLVMPLRAEGSLADWLGKRGTTTPLPPADVAEIISQAAEALQHVHNNNIVHLDIKPANFLLRNNPDRPNVPDLLLADFGIAKFTSATSAMSTTIRGTPIYMAPEQWIGHPTSATDQYSLAILAYQLLTGIPPFQGKSEQIMYQHLQVQPQPPSQRNPQLSPAVDAILLRALAKEPERRFPSVTTFAQALKQALLPQRPPSVGEDIYMSIPLTAPEAAQGGSRPIMLPDGRQAYIAIPFNAFNGQIIRMEGWGKQAPQGGKPGALIVTLTVPAQPKPPVGGTAFNPRVLALIALAIIVVIGSVAGFFVIQNAHNEQVSQQAALTAASATSEVSTAAVLHANNTATASTGLSLAATATATMQVTPTPSTKTVLNDPLQDNSQGNNWDTAGNCSFNADGTYHVTVAQSNTLTNCDAKSKLFFNFSYQVNISILKGDGGGIIFRSQGSDSGSFYYFGVKSSGSYLLEYYNNHKPTTRLAEGPITLNQGQNTIGVVAVGDKLVLYMNGNEIDNVGNSSYSSGQIGVAAENDGNDTDVSFSNAQVATPSS